MHPHHGISRRHVLGLTVAIGGLAMAHDVRQLWAQAPGGSGKVSLDVRHSELHTLITPETLLSRIAGGLGFTEGPVWRGGALLFTDIPNKRIVRWRRLAEGPELTTYPTGDGNWLTPDPNGQMLGAEHDGRRLAPGAPRTPPPRSCRSGSRASGSTARMILWSSPPALPPPPTRPTVSPPPRPARHAQRAGGPLPSRPKS